MQKKIVFVRTRIFTLVFVRCYNFALGKIREHPDAFLWLAQSKRGIRFPELTTTLDWLMTEGIPVIEHRTKRYAKTILLISSTKYAQHYINRHVANRIQL